MSTRILDAYRLPAGTNVLLATRELAPAVREASRPLALSAVGLAAVLMYAARDKGRAVAVAQTLSGLKGHSSVEVADVRKALLVGEDYATPLQLATAMVTALNTHDENARILGVADLRFAVTWLVDPEPNHAGGHDQYARVFTERASLRELFTEVTGALDFHYQDSWDRPSGVTEGHWRARELTWARILPDHAPSAALAPSWDNSLDLENLWVEAMTGAWLTAAAVCDQLQTDGVLKPEGREPFETWLAG